MSAQTPRQDETFYVHGTSAPEQRRLARLNHLLNAGSIEALGLAGGERVLDVGSGLGQLSCAMASAAGPTGRVVGVERSDEQRAGAERFARTLSATGVEFRAGDARALPLRDDEWGQFDVAYTRFLLEHVPDPLAVVRSMVKAVRPGGRVVLEDDDHQVLRIWPEVDGFYRVWQAYIASYVANGNDPFVGRRLVQLLHQAGAPPRRNRWLSFSSCSGDPDFPDFVENVAVILELAKASTVATGGTDAAEVDRVVAAVRGLAATPDSAFWYARGWAEGVVPPR